MIPYTAIRGTWGYRGLLDQNHWATQGSPVADYLELHGLKLITDRQGRGFTWTTALDGWQFWRRIVGKHPDISDWEVGGACLKDYYMPPTVPDEYWTPGSKVIVIAHSHGVNPAIIAAALGMKINVLVTVSSPVRVDVLRKYGAAARKNIGFHLHYWSDGDRMQAVGGAGDRHYGIIREYASSEDHQAIYVCNKNVPLPREAGHSGLLHEVSWFGELLTAVEIIQERYGRADYLECR